MKILVTGGLGAVGAPLAARLREARHEVWVLDRAHPHGDRGRYYYRCDVGEHRQLERVFDEVKLDCVYHAAAEFGRINGEDFYENLWRTNAVGTKNLIRLQEKHGFRMAVFSSSEIYGDYPGVMGEEVPDQPPIQQLNDYAVSKWVNELQVRNSTALHGTETVIVRLFNTYGPGEPYSEYRSVICKFIYCALHGLPYTVYLDHRRTSSYIDDTVRTLATICARFRAVPAVDGDERVAREIEERRAKIEEQEDCESFFADPDVQAHLRARGAPVESDASVIAVPPPVDHATKAPALRAVVAATESILPVLRRGNLVVVESTIPPLATEQVVAPILERSGLSVR